MESRSNAALLIVFVLAIATAGRHREVIALSETPRERGATVNSAPA
ncbi:MAG: hypothetical protein AB1607_13205 [Chloroflexota bacterium]